MNKQQLETFKTWWYLQVGCAHVPGDNMIRIIECFEHYEERTATICVT